MNLIVGGDVARLQLADQLVVLPLGPLVVLIVVVVAVIVAAYRTVDVVVVVIRR